MTYSDPTFEALLLYLKEAAVSTSPGTSDQA